MPALSWPNASLVPRSGSLRMDREKAYRDIGSSGHRDIGKSWTAWTMWTGWTLEDREIGSSGCRAWGEAGGRRGRLDDVDVDGDGVGLWRGGIWTLGERNWTLMRQSLDYRDIGSSGHRINGRAGTGMNEKAL